MFSRRNVLSVGLGAAAALAVGPQALSATDTPLRQRAWSKGLVYGCAVASNNLRYDSAFANAVLDQADEVVAENEMKQDTVQPQRGVWNFAPGEAIASFAQTYSKRMRGHTLIWHAQAPGWLAQALQSNPTPALLTDTITQSITHYGNRMQSWDVVNEAINPDDGHWTGLRTGSPWFRAFGESYVPRAFTAARQANPNVALFYNDYGLEMNTPWHERRRAAALRMLDYMRKNNIPIDGFGIQGHVNAFQDNFNENVFAKFLSDLQGYGVRILITEFDVDDKGGPADIATRDNAAANFATRFLNVAFANPATAGLITWGLSDRYSWLSNPPFKRPDGLLTRGLPLDENMNKTPLWRAIADAFDAAPARKPLAA